MCPPQAKRKPRRRSVLRMVALPSGLLLQLSPLGADCARTLLNCVELAQSGAPSATARHTEWLLASDSTRAQSPEEERRRCGDYS